MLGGHSSHPHCGTAGDPVNKVMPSFNLHYFRDLANAGTHDYRVVKISKGMRLESRSRCPMCNESDLAPLANLIAKNVRIPIGICPLCGYKGYLRFPTKQWLDRFYSQEWLGAKRKDAAYEAKGAPSGLTAAQKRSAHLAEGLAKGRPVCDIGCGNGAILREFSAMGFPRVIGLENSRLQAEITQRRYGYRVLSGAFEDTENKDILRALSPALLFSFHVLEHVTDPAEFIACAAHIQKEGDHLILTVPDGLHEPFWGVFFWLPHLHSYTAFALEKLLNRYGYEIVNPDVIYNEHIMLLAIRTPCPASRLAPSDFVAHEADRVAREFFLRELRPERRYYYNWTRKTNKISFGPAPHNKIIDDIKRFFEQCMDYILTRLFRRFTNRRSLVMSPVSSVSKQGSPCDVYYDADDVALLVR